MKALVLAVALVLVAGVAQADDGQFEAGFEEGFKMVKGDWAILPIPPIPPITPIGSNDYREGLKAGIEAAQKR